VLAVVVIVRVWGRRRRRTTGQRQTHGGLGPFTSDVGLVAAGRCGSDSAARSFASGPCSSWRWSRPPSSSPRSTKGSQNPTRRPCRGSLGSLASGRRVFGKSVGTTVHFVSVADAEAAHADLRSGRVDLAIVEGRELVVNKPIGSTDISTTAQFIDAVSKNLGIVEAVEAAISRRRSPRSWLGEGAPGAQPPTRSSQGATHTTSLIGLVLIFVMLSQYNTWILIGVMEEKSSRVIEVLLAAVRPIQLLTGKVLGIGLVAFVQASAIVVFALVLAKSVGSDLLHGTAPVVLASTLVWLVLGYAFYCWVYAAAGSLAERQDQVQSLAFPLSLPIIFGYIMALTAAGSASPSSFFKVLAYLPPTAPFAMPVLVGLGKVTWWSFLRRR